MINGLSINMFVPDVKKAIELYRVVFDISEVEFFIDELNDNNIGATFKMGGCDFALAKEGKIYKSPLNTDISICIGIKLTTIEKTIKIAQENNFEIVLPLRAVKDRFIVSNIKDPFGYIWCLTKSK